MFVYLFRLYMKTAWRSAPLGPPEALFFCPNGIHFPAFFIEFPVLFLAVFLGFILFFPMIAAPPRDMEITYTKPDSRSLNLTCIARGVYPKPIVRLSWGNR